jgi:hypothetical protein
MANAWGIVSGEEDRPATRHGDYDERLHKAIRLISSSVAPCFLNKITSYIQDSDPQGMWDELAKENRALNPIYQDTITNQFAKETWDLQNETLRTYVTRLDNYRMKLTGTENEITEAQIRAKLLQSLPDTTLWNQAKHFCLAEKRDWNSTLALLQSYEKPLAGSSSIVTKVEGQSKSKGQKGYKHGKKRGEKKDGKSTERTDKKNRVDKDRCLFCHKRGHFQKECRFYKRAQEQVLGKNKNKGQGRIG